MQSKEGIFKASKTALHKRIPTSVLKSGDYTTIPGWNDYVKERHIVAKMHYKLVAI